MSNLVYPTGLLGLKFPVVRRTKWNTLTSEAMSGRVATLSIQQYPLYEWDLEYEWLDDSKNPSDLKTLLGFFNKHGGQFDSFLYTDPVFNTATNEPMGTGDGTTTQFQIVATYHYTGGPGRADIIQNFNGIPTIYVNGSVVSAVTVGPSGVASFTTAPANGAAITWTGAFYYRCRFMNPSLAFSEFMQNWWETEDPITLASVLL